MKPLFLLLVLTGSTLAGVQAQPGKKPLQPKVTPVTGNTAVLKPGLTVKMSAGVKTWEFKSDNGSVEVSYARSKQPKDDVKTSSKASTGPMCLTKDEVRGQKVENEQVIADPLNASQILPGAVIDADVLLNSGEFKYINMDKRKPLVLTTTSNLARTNTANVTPGRDNNIFDDLSEKVHALTKPSNLIGMPNMSSTNEAYVSTLNETTGIKIGASFFYMGIKAGNDFNFSSERYKFMYIYEFEQVCLPVIASTPASPNDLFTETTPMNNNWLYIQEVKYGRRLYVLIETEMELEKLSDKLKGGLNWAAVSAAYQQEVKTSKLYTESTMRAVTQGGQPVRLTDPSQVEKELDKYFNARFQQIDIVPLSYKLVYMDGGPVSVISNAFLNGKNCLDNNKVRVRISKVECVKSDDNKNNEEIYGTASVYLYNTAGKCVAADGKTVLPAPPGMKLPVGSFSYGTKEAPLVMMRGEKNAKEYASNQQGKYTDFLIENLDMKLEIKPAVHEKDNVFNKDDDYLTEDRLFKTIRQILLEGPTSPVFEFRFKNSVMKLYFEITPI